MQSSVTSLHVTWFIILDSDGWYVGWANLNNVWFVNRCDQHRKEFWQFYYIVLRGGYQQDGWLLTNTEADIVWTRNIVSDSCQGKGRKDIVKMNDTILGAEIKIRSFNDFQSFEDYFTIWNFILL